MTGRTTGKTFILGEFTNTLEIETGPCPIGLMDVFHIVAKETVGLAPTNGVFCLGQNNAFIARGQIAMILAAERVIRSTG